MSPASPPPTPLPPDCSPGFPPSAWNPTIAILSSPSWIEKIVNVSPAEPSGPAGKTIFSTSLGRLIEEIKAERRPLVLLHAAAIAPTDHPTARQILGHPSRPLVALLGDGERMQEALSLARELGLGCVLPDDALFHRGELERWGHWMAQGGPPLGVDCHLESGCEVRRAALRRREDKARLIEEALGRVEAVRPDPQFLFDLRLILEETLNNAIFHAFVDGGGREKYSIDNFEGFGDGEGVELAYGADSRSVGLAVTDNRGLLRPDTILSKIERHLSARGVLDQSGRGLYLTYSLSGRAIFNIAPGRLTQVVALFPAAPTAWRESPPLRPILIFQRP